MFNKKKMIPLVVTAIIFLIGVFVISYTIASKYIEITNAAEKEKIDNKKLADARNNILGDDVEIILKNKDKVEESLTLKEYKSKNNIEGDLNREALLQDLKKDNYTLETEKDEQMVFNKISESKLTPNKYYLGEKDGYFAIYKADANGNPTIEDEKQDVFRDYKKVSQLNELDRNKITSFVFSFSTKDEAEEKLSEFIS
ncbi:hypothetical protein [Clostridium sp. YIM B02551]|uniref:hypothetical protein n=1 Tax=Clostridium sp. YIM B02551 TaxID=2910679 RepID=UPI001EEBA8BA|nr:hypothetical protein [Clostridium sp. YIM B02551]